MSPSSFFHKRRAREALRLAKDPLPASPEACASWSLVMGRALHPGPPQTVQGSETSGWSSPPADRDPGGGGAWRNLGARPQAAAEPPVSADPVLSYGAWGTAPAEPGCREGRWCHSEAPHVCLSLSLSLGSFSSNSHPRPAAPACPRCVILMAFVVSFLLTFKYLLSLRFSESCLAGSLCHWAAWGPSGSLVPACGTGLRKTWV